MNRKAEIENKLQSLAPDYLEVINNSSSHAGHGNQTTDQSHFIIKISAQTLKNKSLIEQHRIINNLLKEEFEQGLHALSIQIIK